MSGFMCWFNVEARKETHAWTSLVFVCVNLDVPRKNLGVAGRCAIHSKTGSLSFCFWVLTYQEVSTELVYFETAMIAGELLLF